MKIRSITIFNGAPDARSAEQIARAGKAAAAIRQRLVDLKYEVQTVRLALPRINEALSAMDSRYFIAQALQTEVAAKEAGIDYVSIGTIGSVDSARLLNKLPEMFAATTSIFTSVVLADLEGKIHTNILLPLAKAIKNIGSALPNGFGNLRFAALANCPPGIPFFPAAYARDGDFSFSLAIECANLALSAAEAEKTVSGAMKLLTQTIEFHHRAIEPACDDAARETGAAFHGCDWSLAPHPAEQCSIGAALEKLSGAPFGEWGTLTAIASMTRAIRRANVRHAGFCGVFLPLLEDAVLARRTGAKFDLQRLLLYCSVCGCGLDTVPLAGSVKPEAIAALLADVATLATVLNKPLTARLMPIKGLKKGKTTAFDFPYLVNGSALTVAGSAPGIMRDSSIDLRL